MLIVHDMDRRSALKQISLAAGCIITLPPWMVSCGMADRDTHFSSFDNEHQQVLRAVADTIIPAGGSVGAIYVGVDKYLQKVFDDCYEEDVKKNIAGQLKILNLQANREYGKTFSVCTQPQRMDLLTALRDDRDEEKKKFFEILRSETIRGFTTSQQVMENYLGYQIAPGHYYGCVPVKA